MSTRAATPPEFVLHLVSRPQGLALPATPFTKFGKAMVARKQLMGCFRAAITETREQLQQGEEVPGVLAALIAATNEQWNRLTELELCDNLMLLLLAGHDTSSLALTDILAHLHDHPAAWQALCAEQTALVQKRGQELNSAVLREMLFAQAVRRESLRLRNAIPDLQRIAARDFGLGGYAVPAGTMLLCPLHYLAKEDARWTDRNPEAFRPERMVTADEQKQGWKSNAAAAVPITFLGH